MIQTLLILNFILLFFYWLIYQRIDNVPIRHIDVSKHIAIYISKTTLIQITYDALCLSNWFIELLPNTKSQPLFFCKIMVLKTNILIKCFIKIIKKIIPYFGFNKKWSLFITLKIGIKIYALTSNESNLEISNLKSCTTCTFVIYTGLKKNLISMKCKWLLKKKILHYCECTEERV